MKTKQVFVDDDNKYHETEEACRLADAIICLKDCLNSSTSQGELYFEDFLEYIRKNTILQESLDLIISDARSKKSKG